VLMGEGFKMVLMGEGFKMLSQDDISR